MVANTLLSRCRNCKVEGTILSAECLNGAGEWRYSEIDLNKCVQNEDGKFCNITSLNIDQNLRLASSSRNLVLKGTVLNGRVKHGTPHVWVYAEMDLGMWIHNFDGRLNYFHNPDVANCLLGFGRFWEEKDDQSHTSVGALQASFNRQTWVRGWFEEMGPRENFSKSAHWITLGS